MDEYKNISKIKLWVIASRPKTLPAAVAPVLVGSAVAIHDNVFKPIPAFLALVVSLLIQIGTNFVNDYGDFKKGADSKDRVGPERFLTLGIITPTQMKKAIYITFTLAFASGLYLVYLGGLPALLIGVLSIIAGISYTAGPFPLAYNGLGDFFVFVFFGLVATAGTYYVQAISVSPLVIWVAVPIGSLITNILVVNNYRDADEDKLVNKKTLAVIFGKRFSLFQYIISIVISYIVLFQLYFQYEFTIAIFLPVLLIPLAIKLIKEMITTEGKQLNLTLAKTAMFSVLFSLLFSIGLVI